MPSLDWSVFNNLSGNKNLNFENLCRGLVRLQFNQYGQFKALSNQPGVEFHLQLQETCTLGSPPKWFGWQCKVHTLTSVNNLRAAAKKDIEESLRITERKLPDLTDWVLWTPYTLSKKDQEWFYSLSTNMNMHLWCEEDIDTYLSGDGLILRSTYFGELVLSPEELSKRHQLAIQPIKSRWLGHVHQEVEAERIIRRMLGETVSWDDIQEVGQRLIDTESLLITFKDGLSSKPVGFETILNPFIEMCSNFSEMLMSLYEALSVGDLNLVQQRLKESEQLDYREAHLAPRKLRGWNLPISLDATNAQDDMRIAHELFNEAKDFIGVGLIAVTADAGGGKTQMAAQLTAPQNMSRPAGILFHGRDLHKGQNLDSLAQGYSINGIPVSTMERLLVALDATAQRSGCRLPIVIDGLNEAEDSRDWKAPLAILNEMIVDYPNVLVVCTLRTGERKRRDYQARTTTRESFAIQALPNDIRKIQSEGFGLDTKGAISKYFSYYKIITGDMELPTDFLQHPLNLRIFCEVTNPTHENNVVIEHFPASLSSLFEKYIIKICERISQMINLSTTYSIEDVETAIYKLGIQLWETKKREIDEKSYRAEINDLARSWDCSLVNLLAQEGLIFRNPAEEHGEHVITPVYDALGGYIIASSLLLKHKNDTEFQWFKEPNVILLFIGDEPHELAVDIFNALVSITPRYTHGKHLLTFAPKELIKAATRFLTSVEGRYIDEASLDVFLKLIIDGSVEERADLFARLKPMRGAINHPLNSLFLDKALRILSVSERDLSWSEWIRKSDINYEANYKSNVLIDLLSIESKWKKDLTIRTKTDKLLVKWVMWLLTSPDHELRDVATRSLYWFGRGNYSDLFEETLLSLEINDPYVPERMLAASYGVAMALHTDIENYSIISPVLQNFGQQLFKNIFAKNAPYSTTHNMIREYAIRTIELVLLHNPKLLSDDEIERTKPPFLDEGNRHWGEEDIEREEYRGGESPFRMDFENYSIGRLIKDRGNYDYEHEGYQKVRSQILWRIMQLGWNSDQFKDIDSEIESDRRNRVGRIGGDKYKTDRYGKKYSWIAYAEMSGKLNDEGSLEDWGDERTIDVNLDPSFPDAVPQSKIVDIDLLGTNVENVEDWLSLEGLDEIQPFLCLDQLNNTKTPWVLLDSHVSQKSENNGRSLFCFVRSLLVSNNDLPDVVDSLSKQHLGGRWLPEVPEIYYTFAGEIPWSDIYLENEIKELRFEIGEKLVKEKNSQEVLYLDGERLDFSRFDLMRQSLVDEKKLSDEEIDRIEVKVEEVEEIVNKIIYKKYDTVVPVKDFSWESHHSIANNAGSATVLCREIALDLDLIGKPQSFELFTSDGQQVTYNVSHNSDGYENSQRFFYMREDILKQYLEKNNLSLVWAVWGERQYLDYPYEIFSDVKLHEITKQE